MENYQDSENLLWWLRCSHQLEQVKTEKPKNESTLDLYITPVSESSFGVGCGLRDVTGKITRVCRRPHLLPLSARAPRRQHE